MRERGEFVDVIAATTLTAEEVAASPMFGTTGAMVKSCPPLSEESLLRGMLGMALRGAAARCEFMAIKVPHIIDADDGVYYGPPFGAVEAGSRWRGYAR